MAKWLLKTEPTTYSWADLQKDKTATWDGITNATALMHLRTMKKGDEAIIYHTGGERSAVGIAKITSNPYPDPSAGDERMAVVDLKAGDPLPRPVTLDEIKADPAFADWDLLRLSRLSVVPVPEPIWKHILKLSRERK